MTTCLHPALCALILVFSIGCTNVRSTVRVETQRFEQIPQGKTYSFDTSGLQEDSQNPEHYYAQIEKHLEKLSWRRLPNDDRTADYSIDFTYWPSKDIKPAKSSNNRELGYPYGHAVGGPTAAMGTTSSPWGTGARYSGSPAFPHSRSSTMQMESYRYKVELSIIHRVPGEKRARLVSMWEATAVSGSAATELRRVIPTIIDSLFKNFPGKPNHTYVITRPAKD